MLNMGKENQYIHTWEEENISDWDRKIALTITQE